MFFLQLKTVLWKNFIIRKRHWFLTIIEAVPPVILFIIISSIVNSVCYPHGTLTGEAHYNKANIIKYNGSLDKQQQFYYSPDTGFYREIMKRVQLKFDMLEEDFRAFPSTEALLQEYEKHHNDTVIAITFNGNNLKNLDYTMRVRHRYYSRYINKGYLYKSWLDHYHGSGTSYSDDYFAIQRAVDISFIEQISGKDLDNNLTLSINEFPYPPLRFEEYLDLLVIFLPIATLLSFIFVTPALLKCVVEEKYSGIKELLRMVGMKPWMLWLGWFIHGMFPMIFSIICIVLLLKLPFAPYDINCSVLDYSSGTLIFVFLLLYCMATTTFCFVISSVFNKPNVAMLAGVLIWILTYFVPKYGLGLDEIASKFPWFANILLILLPNMALHYGFLEICLYEQRSVGIQWNNFFKSSSGGADDVTMLNVFVMLIFDMVINMSFTLYMDGVNPGKYGVRKPFLYPFHFSMKSLKLNRSDDNLDVGLLRMDYVEQGKDLVRGIEIQDLVKRYGHKLAVNYLTLNIYQNQITVLLGHNGAGKSSTMAMITGMLGATSGSIKLTGKDIRKHIEEIRKSLGLCPQHNLLFTDLTVGEHLIFLAKLKGKTSKEAIEEMLELLQKFNLSEKKNALPNTLSGGMKRKLCLAMAIIGGSKVLILDEPTSGMDPESRREMWDLLLAWRGEKTILITTHFMEEADALGDWIAIMANGTLQCYGTPMYLKKAFDTGYHLSLMINDSATAEDVNVIKNNIIKYINSAELKDFNGNNMVFLLPLNDNSKITDLLTFLEDNKEKLKIQNLSVTVTTLEDVFLKVKVGNEVEPVNNSGFDIQNALRVTSSAKLCRMRIKALIIKKLQFYKKKVWTYLFPILTLLILSILTLYLSMDNVDDYENYSKEIKLRLSTYKRTTAFYNGTKDNNCMDRLMKEYSALVTKNKGKAVRVDDVAQSIIDKGVENIVYFNEHLIASAEFDVENGTRATALYNSMAVHSAPISLNLITNSLAKTILGGDYSVTVSNVPLKTGRTNESEYGEIRIVLMWCLLMPIGFLLITGSFVVFPHMELSTSFLQLQYMCGVRPWCYWLVNFFLDFGLYLIVSVILVAMTVLMTTFIGGTEYFILLFICVAYGAANIPFSYLFSRMKSASGGFTLFVIVGLFFGIIINSIVEPMIILGKNEVLTWTNIIKCIFTLFVPQTSLIHCLIYFVIEALNNNYSLTGETKSYQEYFSRITVDIILLFLSCAFHITVNIMLDTYLIQKYLAKLKQQVSKVWFRYIKRKYDSNGVDENIGNDPAAEENGNSLKARRLNKRYSGKRIIKNIGFTLKEKECLGILGVNGAGKTTTFRILTRDEIADSGKVEILSDGGRKSIPINQNEYLENLGYCPQADGLNFVLTGRQTLSFIAKLRGIDNSDVIQKFLKFFELEQYADIKCGHYSGGNKRKLSLAVALIGFPKFILLDEPMCGVDPSSRRKFWNLIKSFKENENLSFILASHSMIECEALCNTLKIMKEGRFVKEGTIQELKQQYGGFNIKLKLVNRGRDEAFRNEEISFPGRYLNKNGNAEQNLTLMDRFNNADELKEYFRITYEGVIKDEHMGLLYFYISDKHKKWSTMFKEMEIIKTRNPHLIEDYAISEASLEDIFLNVARSDNIEKKGKKKRTKRRDED